MRVIFVIAKNSSTPVFYQIQEHIKEQINMGILKYDDPIPSERQLSTQLGVSRTTVRKAIRNLVNEGLCTKKAGRGIFVAAGRLTMNIQELRGFTTFAESVGRVPASNILHKRIIAINEEQAEQLHVPPGSEGIAIKRLRLLDNVPIVLESAILSLERFPGLDKHDFSGSLYDVLERDYSVKVSYAQGKLSVSMVDSEDAHILDLPLSSAMMTKTAIAYTESHIPIEIITSVYRSDQVDFSYQSVFDRDGMKNYQ